ncbi:MAG TPA: TetR family transcriptional regulator [Steroidobacteraceae bacterium]|nr:TetR family transcriptional regulator [Steroidobacteraceae bacterium]
MNSVGQKFARSTRHSTSARQLLEATSKILAERNAIDVSLSEIAETSGLNSALIKYHFGSKHGLLLTLVRRDATASLIRLDRLVNLKIPPEQKIRLHVAGVINTYIRYPYLNRLIHLLLTNSDEKITQEIANFFVKPLVDAQSKMLEEGVAQGVFRRTDPMFFYYSIIGACDHIFFARYSFKLAFGVNEIDSKLRESYIDFVSDMALRMLRKS